MGQNQILQRQAVNDIERKPVLWAAGQTSDRGTIGMVLGDCRTPESERVFRGGERFMLTAEWHAG